MYEFNYTTLTGWTGTVRFFASNEVEAVEIAHNWNDSAAFNLVGHWVIT